MNIKAFGKINLTLDVTGRREDGYHLLDSIMQQVDLADEITLDVLPEKKIIVQTNQSFLPVNEKNTAYQAAALFLEYCGITDQGVSIKIEKNIPSRAGMGGGSADAAAVLHGMNTLFDAGLSLDELLQLGEKIGADVPFCIKGGTCRCTGIGEILEEVPSMPDCVLLLCKPPVGMSTPRAYALMDRYPLSGNRATGRMVEALKTGDIRKVAQQLGNRFEETMKLMQVRNIKRTMLSAGALGALMTGSGSVVYGIFQEEEAAQQCAALLEGQGEIYYSRPLSGKTE